jgi:hypothetical protein
MIMTPYKVTNPLYAYTNTTTTKQQHLYPPPKYLEFTKIRSGGEEMLSLLKIYKIK